MISQKELNHKFLDVLDLEKIKIAKFDMTRLARLDERLDVSPLRFNQYELCKAARQDRTFKPIVQRYNGLCEIICNFVIARDMMGQSNHHPKNLGSYDSASMKISKIGDSIKFEYNSPYQDKISLKTLKNCGMHETHILSNSSFWQFLLAFFLNIYPFSIFGNDGSYQNDRRVNRPKLEEALDQLQDGAYVKFMVFNKYQMNRGHAMLIKKTGTTYAFFDPDLGETQSLSFNALCNKIDEKMSTHQATHMAFIDGKQYLQHIEAQKGTLCIPHHVDVSTASQSVNCAASTKTFK